MLNSAICRLLLALQGERLIATVPGAFGEMWITDGLSRRNLRTGLLVIQTAQNKKAPYAPCFFPYKMAGVALGMVPQVKRFLQVGLGGGSFLNAVHRAYPEAHMTAVEVDPGMPDVARRYFQVPEDVETVIEDAVVFFQREHTPYDLIFLDAFDGPYTPASFCNQGFMESVARAMSDTGVVCMNIIRRSWRDGRYFSLLGTFQQVFPYTAVVRQYPFLVPANVILFGTFSREVAQADLEGRLRQMAQAGLVPSSAVRLARRVRWEVRRLGGLSVVDVAGDPAARIGDIGDGRVVGRFHQEIQQWR